MAVSSQQPIEGFMIRLIDGSVWAVKGCVHPVGRVVAVPRRGWWGKTKTMGRSLEIVKRYYRHYLMRLPTGDEAPAVPHNDIVQVLTPSTRCPSGLVGKACRKLLDVLAGCGACGVTGSILTGDWGPESDVDIACYGVDDVERCLRKLVRSGGFRPFGDFASVEVSSVFEGIPRGAHESMISRRLLQGFFGDVPYTLKFVDCSADPFVGADVVSVHRVPRLFFEVVDDSRRYFTPVTYRAWTDRLGDVLLYSLRTRWCEMRAGFAGILTDAAVYVLGDGSIVVNLDRSVAESILW